VSHDATASGAKPTIEDPQTSTWPVDGVSFVGSRATG